MTCKKRKARVSNEENRQSNQLDEVVSLEFSLYANNWQELDKPLSSIRTMENITPRTFFKRKSRKKWKSNSHEKNLLRIRNKKISLTCRKKVKLCWVVEILFSSHDKTDKLAGSNGKQETYAAQKKSVSFL